MAKYNGWSNYETWAVKLWMDNDEGSYRYWRERTTEIWGDQDEDDSDRSWHARRDLADDLKDFHADQLPDAVNGTVFSDLLNAALSDVDWLEIADSLLHDEELDGYLSHADEMKASAG